MAIIKRKTKRAITKQVKKLVKRHGPEIALGLATGLVSTVVNAATADDADKPKRPKAKGKKKDGGKKGNGKKTDDGAEQPETKRRKKSEKGS